MNKLILKHENKQQIEAVTTRVQALVAQLNSLYKSGREIGFSLPGIDELKGLSLDIRTGNFLLPLARKIRDEKKFRTENLIAGINGVVKPLDELRKFLLQAEDGIVLANTETMQSFFDEKYRFYISPEEEESVTAVKNMVAHFQKVQVLRELKNSMGYALFDINSNSCINRILKINQ